MSDPNAVLRRLRALVADVDAQYGDASPIANDFAEAFGELDAALSDGWALPDAWKARRS